MSEKKVVVSLPEAPTVELDIEKSIDGESTFIVKIQARRVDEEELRADRRWQASTSTHLGSTRLTRIRSS
jgi:hypothetical protein